MEIEKKLEQQESFSEILKERYFDSSLIQAVEDAGYIHPTVIQSKMTSLYGERKHVLTREGYVSGKTTGNVIYALQHLITHIAAQNPDHSLMVYLSSSRDNSRKNHALAQKLLQPALLSHRIQCTDITRDDEYERFSLEGMPKNTHWVLFSTPLAFLRFFRNKNISVDHYAGLVIDEPEYCLSFGYADDLAQAREFLDSNNTLADKLVLFSCQQQLDEPTQALKKSFMTKSVSIQVQNEEENQAVGEYKNLIVQQMYNIGSEVQKYVMLYLAFKLTLLKGKTVVLCDSEDSLFRVQLFLSRTNVQHVQIYSARYTKNMKTYVVQTFNSGLTKVILTTPALFEDLANKQVGSGKYVIRHLKALENIVVFDLDSVSQVYQNLFRQFRGQAGTILSLVEQDQAQVDLFSTIIEQQKNAFKAINFKEVPLTQQEISGFEYRITNVVKAISKKQVKLARLIDFKRQILKSPSLEEYFKEHQNEKELIINHIRSMQQVLNKYAERLYEDIPDYLLPEKYRYQRQLHNQTKGKRRITTHTLNPDYEEGLQKRLQGQNLTLDDVKKKPKNDHERFVTIDQDKEDPNITAPENLKIISSRKLWKIRHRKPLKKRNHRAEKKGVFN